MLNKYCYVFISLCVGWLASWQLHACDLQDEKHKRRTPLLQADVLEASTPSPSASYMSFSVLHLPKDQGNKDKIAPGPIDKDASHIIHLAVLPSYHLVGLECIVQPRSIKQLKNENSKKEKLEPTKYNLEGEVVYKPSQSLVKFCEHYNATPGEYPYREEIDSRNVSRENRVTTRHPARLLLATINDMKAQNATLKRLIETTVRENKIRQSIIDQVKAWESSRVNYYVVGWVKSATVNVTQITDIHGVVPPWYPTYSQEHDLRPIHLINYSKPKDDAAGKALYDGLVKHLKTTFEGLEGTQHPELNMGHKNPLLKYWKTDLFFKIDQLHAETKARQEEYYGTSPHTKQKREEAAKSLLVQYKEAMAEYMELYNVMLAKKIRHKFFMPPEKVEKVAVWQYEKETNTWVRVSSSNDQEDTGSEME